ncbi:hypothetical protein DUNSADRAFT_14609 [Dunaliella salina]|uniref:Uncharacterized protein n=1 Tax=Dunaliella salina TaxID=3046 RepID=A0ABQ7H2G9_DUNSA|nr:hypothetical protein DUNSADRAFT_14609 [Dunaliella salina]|eukprot:KAF5841051.1 hypothetical protein DUNSADRAFT_14609 [Dunaliella salina]
MDFSVSSHLKHWLFSSEQLHAHRQRALQECTDRGKGMNSSSPSQGHNRSGEVYEGSEEPSTSAPNSEAKRQRGTTPSGNSPPVSIEEQLLLLRFFESKIGAICAELRLPRKVKIEESYISAEEFCRAARQDASVVLKGEVGVLQALHFDLVVHSPYRALVGFIKSIEEEKAASSPTGSDTSKDNSSSCSKNIDDALLAAPPETIQHCRQSALHALDTLMPTNIDQLGMQRAAKQADQQTEKQQVADVDRRIKLWRSKDPMSNAQSEEYKQAQQAGERDKAAKREAKLRARQESRAQQEAQLLGVPSSALPPK